jgi:hypothetical protein
MTEVNFRVKIRQAVREAARAACALSLCSFLTGCMSLQNEEGRLPNAVRSALSGLTAQGYPDLTKIPDAPTNLPSSAAWEALEGRLVAQGHALAGNRAARVPSAEELNLNWAQTDRSALTTDPRAQPLADSETAAANAAAWARQARAKLEADIARLPPL